MTINPIKSICLAIFFTLSLVTLVQGQKEKEDKERKISLIPLPAIAYGPTTGWMFGVAPGASAYFGDKSTTRISSGLGTLIYTTKKQLLFTAKTNIFLDGDQWNLIGDIRYFITSQPTYGLGTGPQSGKAVGTGIEYEDGVFSQPIPDQQMMDFNYFRFHQTVLKRHQASFFYYGLGVHYDAHSKINDQLLDLDAEPTAVITSHYGYSTINDFSPEGYTMSGLTVNALYDSRDNAINPYSGRYAFVNLRMNPEFLGSDQASTLLWLEYRDYIHLNRERPRHLLGFWTYGWFVTGGSVPYLNLPAVGWDQFGRSGRAYTQGRFRGENLHYTEMEYRFPLQRNTETFGAVLFVNATAATNDAANIDLYDYLDFGYGVGLRVMVNKKSRANLSLDMAWGEYGASGFYFGINEVF